MLTAWCIVISLALISLVAVLGTAWCVRETWLNGDRGLSIVLSVMVVVWLLMGVGATSGAYHDLINPAPYYEEVR